MKCIFKRSITIIRRNKNYSYSFYNLQLLFHHYYYIIIIMMMMIMINLNQTFDSCAWPNPDTLESVAGGGTKNM